MNVKLISISQAFIPKVNNLSDLIAYCARVSNPDSQMAGMNNSRLIRYLIRHNHWSPFEMATVCFEITCPRDIARQILRHRSIHFQEFSQRYAVSSATSLRECRQQDHTNRQNSLPVDDLSLTGWWQDRQEELLQITQGIYEDALEKGIAKEVARAVLPEGLTESRLYASGTVRDWYHYCEVRTDPSTQKEHRKIALMVQSELKELVPELYP